MLSTLGKLKCNDINIPSHYVECGRRLMCIICSVLSCIVNFARPPLAVLGA